MTLKERRDRTGRVTTEGDELYYDVCGQGRPLLMIAGGGGDGWWYASVAEILSDEYTVITYDRRANARSTMNEPRNFEISQQSRDAVAVLHAAGESSAFVFGNSSGAVIALDMAKTQSQAVRGVVVHEPPLARAHVDAGKWQTFFAEVYATAWRFGSSLAALRFAMGVGLPLKVMSGGSKAAEAHRKKIGGRTISSKDAADVLIKLELLPVTNYMPDMPAIVKNGVKVTMAAGDVSLARRRFYAETALIVAKKYGVEFAIFPGHHISFYDMPAPWAAVLRSVLSKEGARE